MSGDHTLFENFPTSTLPFEFFLSISLSLAQNFIILWCLPFSRQPPHQFSWFLTYLYFLSFRWLYSGSCHLFIGWVFHSFHSLNKHWLSIYQHARPWDISVSDRPELSIMRPGMGAWQRRVTWNTCPEYNEKGSLMFWKWMKASDPGCGFKECVQWLWHVSWDLKRKVWGGEENFLNRPWHVPPLLTPRVLLPWTDSSTPLDILFRPHMHFLPLPPTHSGCSFCSHHTLLH